MSTYAGSTSSGWRPAAPVVIEDDAGTLTMKRVSRWTCAARVLAILGVFGIVAAIVIACVAPSIIHNYILDYVSIVSPESPLYDAWLNPEAVGVYTHRKYFFYNLTNPFEVINGTAPHIVEVGPYVYRETTRKYDVRWYLNGTIGYKYQRIMTFVPELSIDAHSGQQLSDTNRNLTVPNPALKGILYRVGKLPGGTFQLNGAACTILHYFMAGIVGPKGYFTQRSAHELLWGYIDEIWEEIHPLISVMSYTASTLFQSQWNGSAVVPSPYTYRQGQMCPLWNDQMACNGSAVDITLEVSGKRTNLRTPDSQLNVSAPGTWIPITEGGVWPPTWQAPVPVPVGPSIVDPSQHGTITSWAGQASLWWWGPMIDSLTGGVEPVAGSAYQPQPEEPQLPPPGVSGPEACRVVSGTDGVRFPPFLKTSSRPQLFIDMIGRAFGLIYNDSVDYDGVPSDRFILDTSDFSDSAANRYCYSQRFNGFVNTSRPAFGPGLGSTSYFLTSCLFEPGALIPNDPNGARRCKDALWKGPDGPWDDRDDDFTGKYLTLNLTWGLATPSDPFALRSSRLTTDQYLEAVTGDSAPFTGVAQHMYSSGVDVHSMSGVTLKGRADAMVSLELGPYTVDNCGTNWTFDNHFINIFNHSYPLPNMTFFFFNYTEKVVRTVIPFLRMRREAEATGYWVDKLKKDLRLIVVVKILTWLFLAGSICTVLVAAVVRLWYVPRIAIGDQSMYERDPDRERLAASLDGGSHRGSQVHK